MLSYTFSYSGTATLQYGQSWDTGSVHVKKNDEEIDSRSNRGSSNAIFEFSSGDVLKILELGSVINIDKLTLEKSGKKKTIKKYFHTYSSTFRGYIEVLKSV